MGHRHSWRDSLVSTEIMKKVILGLVSKLWLLNGNEELFSYVSIVGLFIFLQAKVNNSSLVGVGYTQTLRPGKDFHMHDFCIHIFRASHKKILRSMY